MSVTGHITERMLRQETIAQLKILRRMIDSAIRWKKSHEFEEDYI